MKCKIIQTASVIGAFEKPVRLTSAFKH